MFGIFGKVFLVIVVFVVIWGSVIFYWWNSGMVLIGMEMLVYLGLLLVGVSSVGFMLCNVGCLMLDKVVVVVDVLDVVDMLMVLMVMDVVLCLFLVVVLVIDMWLGLDMDVGVLFVVVGVLL